MDEDLNRRLAALRHSLEPPYVSLSLYICCNIVSSQARTEISYDPKSTILQTAIIHSADEEDALVARFAKISMQPPISKTGNGLSKWRTPEKNHEQALSLQV